MFEQSILAGENAATKTRALAASFGVQCLIVATGLLIPLIVGEHMPGLQLLTKLSAPTLSKPDPIPETRTSTAPSTPPVFHTTAHVLNLPTANSLLHSPMGQTIISDSGPISDPGPYVFGSPGPAGTPSGLDTVVATAPHVTAVTAVPKAPDKPVQVGGDVQAAKLIRKIVPDYPALAKQARIQGTVRLTGVIAKDGSIEQLQVISGNPLLFPAAVAAVKQWLYRPTFLNGVAVEVIAPIDVIFTLSR